MEETFNALLQMIALLAPHVSVMPGDVAKVLGNLVAIAIVLRSALLAFEKLCFEIDVRSDGEVDWKWVGRLGDAARAIDGVIEAVLPVQSYFLRREGPKVVLGHVTKKVIR